MHPVIKLQLISERLEFGPLRPITDNVVFKIDTASCQLSDGFDGIRDAFVRNETCHRDEPDAFRRCPMRYLSKLREIDTLMHQVQPFLAAGQFDPTSLMV